MTQSMLENLYYLTDTPAIQSMLN